MFISKNARCWQLHESNKNNSRIFLQKLANSPLRHLSDQAPTIPRQAPAFCSASKRCKVPRQSHDPIVPFVAMAPFSFFKCQRTNNKQISNSQLTTKIKKQQSNLKATMDHLFFKWTVFPAWPLIVMIRSLRRFGVSRWPDTSIIAPVLLDLGKEANFS